MAEEPPDLAEDPRGRSLESAALLVTAVAALIGLGISGLVRARPWAEHGRALHPPVESERFVVYVNEDDWVTISLLPRIGEKLARRIVAYREQQGPFVRVEEMAHVHGIGEKTVDLLRPYVRLGRRPTTRHAG